MSNKPNIPETIIPGTSYSIWTDTKLNAWLGIPAIISALSDITFHTTVKQWPLVWQVVIVLAQFIAILLWVRSFTRWMRGMDELHQRITLAALLFAVSATGFVLLLWHRLDAAGLFQALSSKHSNASQDIYTVCHTFILLAFFYYLGHAIFNRRYK